jgi:DNA-binding response OmpR family regulator
VIFMSGSPRPEDKVAAFELGAVAYLQKPVEVGHLTRLVREILRRRCVARASDEAVDNRNASSGSR